MTERNKGQFKPGQSGNPGGRPKVAGEVVALARQHTQEAIDTLVSLMRNRKAPAQTRAYACTAIIDRGYGKPSQSMDINTKRETMDQLTDAELAAIAAGTDETATTH